MYGKSSKMLEHEIHLVVHGGLGLCEGCVVLCKEEEEEGTETTMGVLLAVMATTLIYHGEWWRMKKNVVVTMAMQVDLTIGERRGLSEM